MIAVRCVIATSIILFGGIWLTTKLYRKIINKRTVIENMKLNKNEEIFLEVSKTEREKIDKKVLSTSTYKGLYLKKYSNKTLKKLEVSYSTRIHVNITWNEENRLQPYGDMVTTDCNITIVGSKLHINTVESCVREILDSITYQLLIISVKEIEYLKKRRNLTLPKVGMKTGTLMQTIPMTFSNNDDKTNNKTTIYIIGEHKNINKARSILLTNDILTNARVIHYNNKVLPYNNKKINKNINSTEIPYKMMEKINHQHITHSNSDINDSISSSTVTVDIENLPSSSTSSSTFQICELTSINSPNNNLLSDCNVQTSCNYISDAKERRNARKLATRQV